MCFILAEMIKKTPHLYWKSSLSVKIWAREDVSLSKHESVCEYTATV